MTIELNVVYRGVDCKINFSKYDFSHAGCGQMCKYRNPETSEYTLRCKHCSLEITFPQLGECAKTIHFAVIDGEMRTLPAGSYDSETKEEIRIVPQDAA